MVIESGTGIAKEEIRNRIADTRKLMRDGDTQMKIGARRGRAAGFLQTQGREVAESRGVYGSSKTPQ